MLNSLKFFESKEFKKISIELKKDNLTIVFTNGCFDILHPGHISYLHNARLLGDYLVVGVNSDRSVNRLKGMSRPINNLNYRMFMLASLQSVDAVISFEDDTPYELISDISPSILVKGGDYKESEIVGHDLVTNSGGKVVILDYLEEYSSTKIINSLSNGK